MSGHFDLLLLLNDLSKKLNPSSLPNLAVPCYFNELKFLAAIGWHYGFFAVNNGFTFA